MAPVATNSELEGRVKDLENTVYGNGRRGLKDEAILMDKRVEIVEAFIADVQKFRKSVLVAVFTSAICSAMSFLFFVVRALIHVAFPALLIVAFVGCSHLAPQGHDEIKASVYQRTTPAVGEVRETSATLTLDRREYLGDKATTMSLSIDPAGVVTAEAGQQTGKQSAVSAWGALMGFLGGLFAAGGI